jgi:uncharacterized membrane protein
MAMDVGERESRGKVLPTDLLLVVGVALLTAVFVFVPGLGTTPVRTVLGLAFVLFVPGYVFIAVLFPSDGSGDGSAGQPTVDTTWVPLDRGDRAGIDRAERVVLSFVASIALASLTGLALGLVVGGIGLVSVFLVLGGVTALGIPVVVISRSRLPPHRRFRVKGRATIAWLRSALFKPDSAAEASLNLSLVVLLVLALVVVGTGGQASNDGAITELYLLTPNDEGELTSTDYPSTLDREGTELSVHIGNYEGEQRSYTTLVLLQRVETGTAGGDVAVVEERQLDRFRTTLEADETTRHTHSITAPDMAGEDLRLVYLLYVGDPPAEPTVANAYRELHVWVDTPAASAHYEPSLRVENCGPTEVMSACQ